MTNGTKKAVAMLAAWAAVSAVALANFAAIAANKVTVSTAAGHPGDEVQVTVSLTNSDAVCAMQLTVPLDANVRYADGSAKLGTRAEGHKISAASNGKELRIYIYSTALATLGGNSGDVCTFALKLGKEPGTYSLAPKVLLSDADGKALDCQSEAGEVTLLSPKITAASDVVDFGRVPIASTHTRSVSVGNAGNEVLHVKGITFGRSDMRATEEQFAVAPGESHAVTIEYAPTVWADSMATTMTIASDAVNGAKTIVVKSVPYSVDELHVQQAEGECAQEVEVALKVNNMEPLTALQCEFELPEQLEYVAGSLATTERSKGFVTSGAAKDGKLVLYLYSPNGSTMEGNDGNAATFRLRLNGESDSYWLGPRNVILSNVNARNMTSATSGNYVTINSAEIAAADCLDMGATAVTQKACANYRFANRGRVPLRLERVTFLADSFSVVTPLPVTVAPGEEGAIEVQYSPSREGAVNATMNLYTNDPTNRLKPVAVTVNVFEPDTMKIDGEMAADRKSYALRIGLDNYTQDLSGLQLDIHWTKAAKFESIALSDRLKGFKSTVAQRNDSVWRVIVYSLDGSIIGGNSGELFALKFSCPEILKCKGTTVRVDGIRLSNSKGEDKSSVGQMTYAVKIPPEKPKTPVFTPGGGKFAGKVTVALSCATAEAKIHYTTDGSEPTSSSPVYEEPIVLTATTTIKAVAIDEDVYSDVAESVYEKMDTVAKPEFTPGGGKFAGRVEVTLKCATAGAEIHYTTDGSVPTAESAVYGDKLVLAATMTVKAIAVKEGFVNSEVAEATYEKMDTVAKPEFVPGGGKFAGRVEVALQCATAGAEIHYTTDGSMPTAESAVYGDKLVLAATTTVKAIAVKEGFVNSEIAEATYEKMDTVAKPEFTPGGGKFAGKVEVTLKCATAGAEIHYTTDGSMPTAESAVYGDKSIVLAATTTVKAIAIKDGFVDSEIAETTYEKMDTVAKPEFTPGGEEFVQAVTVEISCSTDGAEIYYTLDGSEPTVGSQRYEASIEITSTTTIKAIAVKDGYVDSEVSEATYTKTSGVEQTYADKEVDRVEFYDLVGRRLKGLTPGNMTVVRILYKDGTARSMKLMKK